MVRKAQLLVIMLVRRGHVGKVNALRARGYTSGALHLCKRIAHVENCEVLGWYSAMIARHDGGKSAPIVAASHAFFFSTK